MSLNLIIRIISIIFILCASKLLAKPANVIIIFTDDQGYQDLGIYGSELINTPNIDKLAKDGLRFTDFYVASSVCSASRAALLTGQRGAINGVENVYWPNQEGMKSNTTTIAEVLKTKDYATAAIGKWHLGDQPNTLPTSQGFDEYFGIPYSNDMYIGPNQNVAKNIKYNDGYNLEKLKIDQTFVAENMQSRAKTLKKLSGKVPLMYGQKIVEYPTDQATLTHRYFQHSKRFITQHKEQPFFLYLAPAMPHVPLYASEKFSGKSQRGKYGDVIEELDWEVGQLRQYLELHNLAKNTLIIFASDNGPWLSKKEDSGTALPLRDGKFSNFEGGVRVPAIMYWPNVIPANTVSHNVTSTMDIYPTLAEIAGVKLNPAYHLDGKSLLAYFNDPIKKSPQTPYFYNLQGNIAGVRLGDWKYLRVNSSSRSKKSNATALLFNLKSDISEQHDLAASNVTKVRELEHLIIRYEQSLPRLEANQ